MWVVIKITVPFWVPYIIRTYYIGYPKRDHNFDNHPCSINPGSPPTGTGIGHGLACQTRLAGCA